MGYSTDFSGSLTVTPPLNEHEAAFLADFSDTRHTSTDHGPLEIAGPSVSGNDPQFGKPGIWCHWIVDKDGELAWDGQEKTYNHDQWLAWLIQHLFGPEARAFVDEHLSDDPRLQHFTCDHTVNGTVDAQGEEPDDMWRIKVVDNDVTVQYPEIVYSG